MMVGDDGRESECANTQANEIKASSKFQRHYISTVIAYTHTHRGGDAISAFKALHHIHPSILCVIYIHELDGDNSHPSEFNKFLKYKRAARLERNACACACRLSSSAHSYAR